jgi:hypothetical protein
MANTRTEKYYNRTNNTMEKRIKKRVPGLSLSKVIKTRKALNRYFNDKNTGYKNFRKAGLPEEVSETTAYSIVYGNNNNNNNNTSSQVSPASMNQISPMQQNLMKNVIMNAQMNQSEPMAPIVIPNSMTNNPIMNSPIVNSPHSPYNNFMKKYGKTAKAPTKKAWVVANRGGRRTRRSRSKKTKSKSRRH